MSDIIQIPYKELTEQDVREKAREDKKSRRRSFVRSLIETDFQKFYEREETNEFFSLPFLDLAFVLIPLIIQKANFEKNAITDFSEKEYGSIISRSSIKNRKIYCVNKSGDYFSEKENKRGETVKEKLVFPVLVKWNKEENKSKINQGIILDEDEFIVYIQKCNLLIDYIEGYLDILPLNEKELCRKGKKAQPDEESDYGDFIQERDWEWEQLSKIKFVDSVVNFNPFKMENWNRYCEEEGLILQEIENFYDNYMNSEEVRSFKETIIKLLESFDSFCCKYALMATLSDKGSGVEKKEIEVQEKCTIDDKQKKEKSGKKEENEKIRKFLMLARDFDFNVVVIACYLQKWSNLSTHKNRDINALLRLCQLKSQLYENKNIISTRDFYRKESSRTIDTFLGDIFSRLDKAQEIKIKGEDNLDEIIFNIKDGTVPQGKFTLHKYYNDFTDFVSPYYIKNLLKAFESIEDLKMFLENKVVMKIKPTLKEITGRGSLSYMKISDIKGDVRTYERAMSTFDNSTKLVGKSITLFKEMLEQQVHEREKYEIKR